MLDAEVNNELTILDYLNEDCWRAVLRLVPMRDLIATERASRRWQEVVLTYLRGVQISIEENETSLPNACKLELSEDTIISFASWTKKLGPSVVDAYCNNLESLEIIKDNCPNIKALKLVYMDNLMPTELLPYNLNENFKFVQRVTIDSCPIEDPCISQFLADRALEELKLFYCNNVTGRFFKSTNLSKLECLVLDSCNKLEPAYILPTIDRLSELKKFSMNDSTYEVLEELQHVLDKMPKLEWLELSHDVGISCYTSVPLSRLTRLKHLRVPYQLGDEDVEAVTRGCQDLQTLDLQDCQALAERAIERLCARGGGLRALRLGRFYDAEDDDVVALVRGCTGLTSLTVAGAGELTPALPARAAAARRTRPAPGARARLRLCLADTNLADEDYLDEVKGQYEEMKTEYEDLIVVLN